MENTLDSPPEVVDAEGLVKDVLIGRQLKSQLKKQYEDKAAAIDMKIADAERKLQKHLDSINAESVKTAAGTAYKTTTTYTNVSDFDSLLEYVRQTENWQLLQKAVNKSAVVDILKDTGEVVPGVALRQEITVNVRSS